MKDNIETKLESMERSNIEIMPEINIRSEVKKINTYYPTCMNLFQLTGTETIKDGCAVLGISETLFRRWRTEGMSEATKNKYWGSNESRKLR